MHESVRTRKIRICTDTSVHLATLIRPISLNNATSIVSTCNFDIRAFFGLLHPHQPIYIRWCLVSGSYSKSHDSSQVITHLRMFSDSIASSRSWQTSTQLLFCPSVRFFGISLAQSFRRCDLSFKIKRTRLSDSLVLGDISTIKTINDLGLLIISMFFFWIIASFR